MYNSRQQPDNGAPPRHHFWNRSSRHPADQRGDYYVADNYGAPMYSMPGPHSEFRQGPRGRWEHSQYADNMNVYDTTQNKHMSRREKNMYATPFGTPGFAAENLLADNPWTHDTLGYDYYDYFADQAVRGPFGVAPGSVLPPSQRPFVGRNPNNSGAPRRGFGYKMFHRGAPNQPSGGNYPSQYGGPQYGGPINNGPRGLNQGYVPPGAQFAHTNQPYVSETYHDQWEDTLPDGGWEKYETEVSQVTNQDVVVGGRGTNATKSQWGNTRNPSMTTTLPMNIPTAATSTTTISSTTTDGLSVPITDSMEKRETVVSAENPTTGLPLNSATVKTKNAM